MNFFEGCRNDNAIAPSLKKMLADDLAGVFERLSRSQAVDQSASGTRSFSPDSWLRGVLLPATSQTWSAIEDSVVHRLLPDLVKDAMECANLLKANPVVASSCERTLQDLDSYANLLRAGEEKPTLSMSEVVLSAPGSSDRDGAILLSPMVP